MASLIGKTIKNRYKVIEFLGRGGMAEVYKVEDNQRGVYLAMKVLREDLAEDRVFLRRFQREAHNLAKLQHPNIVRFYGLEQEGRLAFILMDYIKGTTLRGEIFDANKPLSKGRIVEIFTPVCKALHYAHQTGIVHCDVKTSNIMIDKHGTVFLADFGIARMADAATSTMVGIGTPAYMAPELIRGENPTPQTDIYALGVILFEMLTGGERPFIGEHAGTTGTTAEKVRWEHLKLAAPSPRIYNKAVSAGAEAAVLQCLEKKQTKRFASTIALLGVFGGDVQQLKKEPIKKTKKQTQKKEAVQTRRVQHANCRPAGQVETKPIWQRWTLWTGLAATAVVALLLTQITHLPAVELPILPTNTLPATAEPTRTPPPILTPTPALGVGSTIVFEKDNMTLVYVPEGEFEMGGFDHVCDGYSCETTLVHEVFLNAYWIDKTEITNVQYLKCVEEGVCEDPVNTGSNNRYDYYGNGDYDNFPVIFIDWYQAENYCNWAGRRLPTEAEWEKAERGTDGRIYPWGDESPYVDKVIANNCISGEHDTVEVGSYPLDKSPYGVLDMGGNVMEWIADWYDSDYYTYSEKDNPQGPALGKNRVLRGGLFDNYYGKRECHRWDIGYCNPNYRMSNVGFRCALSP